MFLLMISTGKKLLELFRKNNCKKQIRKSLELKKRKGNTLYLKWARYNNSFNSWIDKKDIL